MQFFYLKAILGVQWFNGRIWSICFFFRLQLASVAIALDLNHKYLAPFNILLKYLKALIREDRRPEPKDQLWWNQSIPSVVHASLERHGYCLHPLKDMVIASLERLEFLAPVLLEPMQMRLSRPPCCLCHACGPRWQLLKPSDQWLNPVCP